MKIEWRRWFQNRGFSKAFEQARQAAAGTPLEDYYDSALPRPDDMLETTSLVALDFESDGLGTSVQLLEAGWVNIENEALLLNTARQMRIRADNKLKPSAVIIHRITDDAAAEGASEQDVLATLVKSLAGRAIIAHAAAIERDFLNTACLRCFGAPFVGRFICTMQLEQRWFPKVRASDGLRLGKLRAQYGLPSYKAHDGLTDAMACGELFLAQIARKREVDLRLGALLMRD